MGFIIYRSGVCGHVLKQVNTGELGMSVEVSWQSSAANLPSGSFRFLQVPSGSFRYKTNTKHTLTMRGKGGWSFFFSFLAYEADVKDPVLR